MTDRREQEDATMRDMDAAMKRVGNAEWGPEERKVRIDIDPGRPGDDKTVWTSNAGPVVYKGDRFLIVERAGPQFLIFEQNNKTIIATCDTKLAADTVVVAMESMFKGASVQALHERTTERDYHIRVADKLAARIREFEATTTNPVPSPFDLQVIKERDIAQEGWNNCRQRYADSRRECETLREALSKALSYCDAAVHQTEQYHDEREALHLPLQRSHKEGDGS